MKHMLKDASILMCSRLVLGCVSMHKLNPLYTHTYIYMHVYTYIHTFLHIHTHMYF
jgi:hypothetical protein